MRSNLAIWSLVGLCAIGQNVIGQTKPEPGKLTPKTAAPDAQKDVHTLYEFRLIAIQESMLSAMKPGVIMTLPVKEGDSVEEGVVLGQIDDRESQANIKAAKAELAVAEKQASSDAPVQAAIATHEVSKAELQNSTDINSKKPGAINDVEIERLELTMLKAKYQIAVAEQELGVAKLNIAVKDAQREVAELDADLRKIKAPYSGEVVEMKHHVGEWVQAGDPVLHLVQMDRLRVQGYLDLVGTKVESEVGAGSGLETKAKSANSSYGVAQPAIDPTEILGRDCEVLVQLPKGRTESFKSTVAFISPVQNVGGKIRVWIEIENKKVNGRWLAQPGQMATVNIFVGPKAPAGRPVAGAINK